MHGPTYPAHSPFPQAPRCPGHRTASGHNGEKVFKYLWKSRSGEWNCAFSCVTSESVVSPSRKLWRRGRCSFKASRMRTGSGDSRFSGHDQHPTLAFEPLQGIQKPGLQVRGAASRCFRGWCGWDVASRKAMASQDLKNHCPECGGQRFLPVPPSCKLPGTLDAGRRTATTEKKYSNTFGSRGVESGTAPFRA